MKKHSIFRYIPYIALLCVALLTRCNSIDHYYADFLTDAERIYPGRVDSIQFKPGNTRGIIRARISTDSRVSKIKVTWPQGGNFETAIAPEEIAEYKEILIPNIPEGRYTFEIRTYDQEGNQSMRSEVFGRVYGKSYVDNLNNRIASNIEQNGNDIRLNWFVESIDTTQLGAMLTYPTTSGDSTTVFVASRVNQTPLPGINLEGNFTYRTLYKPSSLAIDTFYAAPVVIRSKDLLPPDREEYPFAGWSIAAFSSEEPNNSRLASRLIDGRDDTFWIARFSNNATKYPDHFVTIDMGQVLPVNGFFFAQKNGDRKIKEMEVYVSNDNRTWEIAAKATLAAVDRTKQYFDLPQERSFRYFRIVPINGHDSQGQPGLALAGAFKFVPKK